MRQGYFSIVRWRRDPTRDEARNLAVILVDNEGEFGGVRAISTGNLSPALQRQGILDSLVRGIEGRFDTQGRKPDLSLLRDLQERFGDSILVTEPQQVAVSENPEDALRALYRAYVQPSPSGSRGVSKGQLARRLVSTLQEKGFTTERNHRHRGFVFDIVATSKDALVAVEVLSFATANKNPMPFEHDAAHFLFAVERSRVDGLAVVQPPAEMTTVPVAESHHRVMNWMREAEVIAIRPEELATFDLQLSS